MLLRTKHRGSREQSSFGQDVAASSARNTQRATATGGGGERGGLWRGGASRAEEDFGEEDFDEEGGEEGGHGEREGACSYYSI